MNALLFLLYYALRASYFAPQILFMIGLLSITRKILKWVW